MSSHHVSINLSLRTLINSTLLSDAALHKFTDPDFCIHIETMYCRGKRKTFLSVQLQDPLVKKKCVYLY